jgi:lantibiotic modifying enzyme
MRAAARDSVARLAEVQGFGFHSGAAGTAALLAEAGRIASDPVLEACASTALDYAASSWERESREWDLIHGHAGFALGAIIAAKLLQQPIPAVLPEALDRLCEQRRNGGWRTTVTRGRRVALTGLAHGASGAALALATGTHVLETDRWEAEIRLAVSFERRWRVAATGGWTDRRQPGNREAIAWCHGAAGIGLTEASISMGEPDTPASVSVAAERIMASVAGQGGAGCLCHGRIGNLLVLHELGSRAERPEWAAFVADALPQTRFDIDTNPSLMLGGTGAAIAWYVLACGAPAPRALTLTWE